MGSAEVQGRLWSISPSEWAELQEPQHADLYFGALDSLAPLEGLAFLDAGCGSGMVLEHAADRGARVSGLDAAPGLVDYAAKRVPTAAVRIGDLEQLPFEDDAFDIVTAFNSLQYAADPRAALRECARVTKPTGRVLVGQWSDPSQCQSETVFQRLRQLAPPPPDAPQPLKLAGAGQLEMRMVESGLQPYSWGEAVCRWYYPDLETAWVALRASGPSARVIAQAGEEQTRRAVLDAFRDGQQPDGSVVHMNTFRWVIAQPSRPAP